MPWLLLLACEPVSGPRVAPFSNLGDGGVEAPRCVPGDTRACRPPGKEGLACASGEQRCGEDGTWGSCVFDELPIAGTWVLTGEGRREACQPSYLDAPRFSLAATPLVITQTSSESFGLASPPSGFRMVGGELLVRCVRFRTIEDSDRGAITYDWSGEIEGPGRIEGNFTGSGPGSCATRGSFRIDY
ncbi:MAG: hypothetical protein IPG45_01055 [Deltaproteobacteria bacterium]|nr:hypothetical protein [Deltaproteobacteria bacterium]